MKPKQEVVPFLTEMQNMLAADESENAKLKALVTRAIQAISDKPDVPQLSGFAPLPRTVGERLISLVEGMLNLLTTLTLALIVLVLAFSKSATPPTNTGCVSQKCCCAPCEQGKEGSNG